MISQTANILGVKLVGEFVLKSITKLPHLLLTGVIARLTCALIVMVVIWLGFFWATLPPGGT